MKGSEEAYLVSDKATKMYSLTKDSEKNHPSKPPLQDEENPQSKYHCHNNNKKAYDARQREQTFAKKKLCIASLICFVFISAEIVEILGALMSVITIWLVTGVLVYLACERLIRPDYTIDGTVMLITSACALGANLVLALILHQSGHGHSHAGGKHEHMASEYKPQTNASIRAAFIHVIGDLFQSISVLISALIIYFKPEYKMADPICTFIFSIFVLITTVTVLRDLLTVLMEGTPRGIHYSDVKQSILDVDGVKSVHSLHLWALTMNQVILSAHIATDIVGESKRILKDVTQNVFARFPFHSVTIQVEPIEDQSPECMFCYEPTQ
eukprot:XP_017950114.1 PREDICTED: zinc transporter 8 isoform X1 [Xenopus tropicalis]